jgi:hypothetical protein
MERWLSRWAPLASIPAAALIVVANFAGGGNSPNDNAPVAQVVKYYTAHAAGQKVSALAGALGLVFLVFFAMALAGRVRAGGAGGWLASGVIGGAVLAAVGFLPLLTFSFILGMTSSSCSPPLRRRSTCSTMITSCPRWPVSPSSASWAAWRWPSARLPPGGWAGSCSRSGS